MTESIVHRNREGTAQRTAFGYLTEDHPSLDRVQNTISMVCGVISGAAILAVTLLTLVDVAMRSLFASPLGWSVAFIEQYLLTAAAFFGIVTAYRSGAHVAVVSVFNRMGPSARKGLLILSYVIVVIGMCALGIAGLNATIFSFGSGEGPVPGASELAIPSGLWRSIVPVSMLLGVVVVMIDLFRELAAPWTVVATDYDPGDEVDAVLEEVEHAQVQAGGAR